MRLDLESLGVDEAHGSDDRVIHAREREAPAFGPVQNGPIRPTGPWLDLADGLNEVVWPITAREVLGLDEGIEDHIARGAQEPRHEHGRSGSLGAVALFREHASSSLGAFRRAS